jgi:putative sterol carrier protein
VHGFCLNAEFIEDESIYLEKVQDKKTKLILTGTVENWLNEIHKPKGDIMGALMKGRLKIQGNMAMVM